MKTSAAMAILVFLSISCLAHAGTIEKGSWKPSDCGDKPITPAINEKDLDSYNNSVEVIASWQLQAKIYYECLVKEATADNALVVGTANREQAEYANTIERLRSGLAAAENKFKKIVKPPVKQP